MADNFDTLSIKITASAQVAIKQVNKLADALDRLNTSLSGIDSSGMTQVSEAASSLSNSITVLRGSGRTVSSIARSFAQVGNARADVAQTADAAEQLAQASESAAQAAENAAQSVGSDATGGFRRFGDTARNVGSSVKSAFSSIAEFSGKVASNLAKIFPHANKAASGIKKVSHVSKSASLTSKGLAKELLRISKMLKLMITRMVLRKIITGVGDGFKNLAQYSKQFDATISLLWNSFRQLGNSIAASVSPLLNALAPALNYIIQLVIRAVNAINQLISALMGLGVWTKAKTLTDDYAKSLGGASKAAKELKKTVLGFDELNQLQDNSNSGGGGGTSPADMFEESEIDKKWKDLADKLKKYWESFINPIKRAWARAGEYVKKAWIRAFKNVKKLVIDIVDDFLEVWNQPQTVHMLEDMFRIIGNIGTFIGNIANSLDRAWNKAEVGKRIFEKIRDICAIIVAKIEDITLSWALWADKLDFSPFFESLAGWLESLKKPIEAIMGVVQDLNEHFLQPFTKWLVESGIPSLIDVFTRFNEAVKWDVIRERLDRLWTALEPFAEVVGEGLIIFIERISDALANFLNSPAWDWFIDTLIKWTENVDAEDVADGLEKIFWAIMLFKATKWIVSCTSALIKFFGVFGGAEATATITNAGLLAGALKSLLAVLGGYAIGNYVSQGWISRMADDLEKATKRTGEFTADGTNRWSAYFRTLSKEYSGFGGVFRMIKDAITGDLNNLTYEVKNFNGEVIAVYTVGGKKLIEFTSDYGRVAGKTKDEIADMNAQVDDFGTALEFVDRQTGQAVGGIKSFGNTTDVEANRINVQIAKLSEVTGKSTAQLREEFARTGNVVKVKSSEVATAVTGVATTTETTTETMKQA